MSNFVGSTGGVTKTGSNHVDSLLWGTRWKIENDDRKLTYSFIDNKPWDYYFDNAEINAYTNAIQAWANVANFKLEYSGFNDPQAELTFHVVDSSVFGSDGVLGQAQPPGEYSELFGEGDVLVNWEAYQDNPNAALAVGGYHYYTFIHEIGHALGLAHPHDNGGGSSVFPGVDNASDYGDFNLNQFLTTVMSYNTNTSSYSPGYSANWGFAAGPMAFDIAAIQHIYGINKTYNTGNNVYFLPSYNGVGTYWSCIWDAGGTDTISGEGASNSVIINLNNATLANNDPNAGGFVSQVVGIKGGFTIANSQGGIGVIENAIGSAYNDTLTGNEYNNYIFGGGGNDAIAGGSGNDSLNGGSGNDAIYGDAGNDTLIGSSGNDFLNGGTGNDTALYQTTNAGVNVNLFTGRATDGLGGNDTLTSIERVIASNFNDSLTGGAGNETLEAGSGNDILIGGAGNDVLLGGSGSDTLTGGTGADRFTFKSRSEGFDRITDFSVIDDTLVASAAGFGGGLVAGAAIAASQFVIGTAATTASHRFIYNQSNGALFFDQDGTGSLGRVQIAVLGTGLSLTNADILVSA